MLAAKEWLERKAGYPGATVASTRTVTKEYRRHTGRILFAQVTLTVSPAPDLSLRFKVDPTDIDYRAAIEDTVFCALLSQYRQPVSRVAVTIEDVKEDDIGSSYHTFKMATSEAIHEALMGPSSNIVWA